MLQRARVPSTRQEAVASSCPKTRVLVSYYWARPLAARCARQRPVQGPSPCRSGQDRSARPSCPSVPRQSGKAKAAPAAAAGTSRCCAVPAAGGVAACRRDSYATPLPPRAHISRPGQPSRQAFAFGAVGQRRGSRIRGAAGACEIYRCSCCRPAGCCLRLIGRGTQCPHLPGSFRCTGGE